MARQLYMASLLPMRIERTSTPACGSPRVRAVERTASQGDSLCAEECAASQSGNVRAMSALIAAPSRRSFRRLRARPLRPLAHSSSSRFPSVRRLWPPRSVLRPPRLTVPVYDINGEVVTPLWLPFVFRFDCFGCSERRRYAALSRYLKQKCAMNL